ANTIRYDIAEIVDGHVHVAAKIGKSVLAQLPKPAAAEGGVLSGGVGLRAELTSPAHPGVYATLQISVLSDRKTGCRSSIFCMATPSAAHSGSRGRSFRLDCFAR